MTKRTPKERTPFEVALGAVIPAEARFRGISMKELSARTGIPPRTMQRYLDGEGGRPMAIGDVIKFADALGMDLRDLLDEARKRERQGGRVDPQDQGGLANSPDADGLD